jgi:hypothetical protein
MKNVATGKKFKEGLRECAGTQAASREFNLDVIDCAIQGDCLGDGNARNGIDGEGSSLALDVQRVAHGKFDAP